MVMPLPPVPILSMFAGMGNDLFDAAQMYDEDYLYFFAAESGSEFAPHGPAVPGTGVPGKPPQNWPGGCWICGRA